MLKIYRGRESVDKEKFIYERVRDAAGETFVIVPNQYTLAAEEQALRYLDKACLYNVEIISMNRLGRRLLMEKGLENVPMLDKYGRFMLLSRIIKEKKGELEIFGRPAGKRTFTEMVNDFISDLKQQDCTADDLEAMLEAGGANELLRKKLSELKLIFDEYERRTAGKYTDSEDLIAMYTEAIADSALIRGKDIWVYGFDSITPKFRNTVTELAACARSVNFVVNESDFGLGGLLTGMLLGECREKGIDFEAMPIPEGYEFEKAAEMKRLESELFARGESGEGTENALRGDAGDKGASSGAGESALPPVSIVECANPYYEAESAAVYVYKLIRDEGYRMSDIAIVSNDEENMQPKIRRTFEEYGLPLFVDSRRSVGDSQAASLIVSLLRIVKDGFRTADVMTLLKSGLGGYADELTDELENYARSYKIRGSMWKKPFEYGAFEYDEETFAKLEELRADIVARIAPLAELAAGGTSAAGAAGGSRTMSDFTRSFYDYLNDEWKLEERIAGIAAEQSENGMEEEAARTVQSCEALLGILDRIREICGEADMDPEEFLALYLEGVDNIEIGMIPPYVDGLSMGTMIRTRPAPIKALLVLGANEGVLPMEPSPEGLFSVDEKAYFKGLDFPLGALDDIKMLEESAAMYRMLSKPSERVYISYSLSDGGSGDMRPSSLIDAVRELFPDIKVDKDVVSSGFGTDMVNGKRETLRHLMNHLKARPAEAAPGDLEKAAPQELLAHAVMSWYEAHEPELLAPMVRAGLYDNAEKPLGRDLARRLYAGNDAYKLSPSQLERFDHCPFRHFVVFGLKPKEEREYSGDARAIGDVYHECIMRVSRRLMAEENGRRVSLDVSEADIERMVDEELSALSEKYRDGLFVSTEREKYRIERIAAVCRDAVRVLAEQMKNGELREACFEERFGRGCRFEPIVYDFDGEKIYIEGKIDRVDIMSGGEVRVIDYKTGNDKLDIEQMREGYKMQLMVYLESTVSGELEPAGMFYFNIKDMDEMLDDNKMVSDEVRAKTLADREAERFVLKGAVINEPDVLSKMPESVLEKKAARLSREAFSQLQADVRSSIERLSGGIAAGDISINPTRTRDKRSECQYCEYKPICRFDLSYRGNRYRSIK